MNLESARWCLALDGSRLPERDLIGGKAWSVARMIALGLRVPPAFVVTTEACAEYARTRELPDGLLQELRAGISWLEVQTGRTFGGSEAPLLVSVRSGAAVSMPGMMDTVLNLGINSAAEQALAKASQDPRFARDTHRRFYEMYARIVLKATVPELDPGASPAAWQERIERACGQRIPDDVFEQLDRAVCAVFDSSQSRRARRYRRHHSLPDTLGTAVTVQAMVFGNLDDRSGTGVLFSRNPLTGEPTPYGEYLSCAQGEDVVSGNVTPSHLDDMQIELPEVHAELLKAADELERANRDIQDIEFTVQHGRLFLLQSRVAKRAAAAAVRAAIDMVHERRIDRDEALRRVTPAQVRTLLSPVLADDAARNAKVLAHGLGACPGIGSGVVVTDSDDAEVRAEHGERVVLARSSTSPEDVHGMVAASAVITETGGSTSHAAVVGRALGRPSVVGCGDRTVTTLAGQEVTVDGTEGRIYAGTLEVRAPEEREDERLATLLEWARERSPLTVYRPDEVPETEASAVVDLNTVEDGEDPLRLDSLLAGYRGARGGAVASDEGVAAAIRCGLGFIVADPTLPALLAACHAATRSATTSDIAV